MIHHGDCLEVLRGMDADSVDSMVTDPPAGIGFMGKHWDKFVDKGIYIQCLRVLKPGAHALVWAIPRTSHHTAHALEGAGFDIRDVITHLFGSGFPKSHNLGNGFGTALKPASEHWILCRKPLSEKTIAANVLKHGVGGLNIDGCRIGYEEVERGRFGRVPKSNRCLEGGLLKATDRSVSQGRFPANLVLDELAAEMLDAQSGVQASRYFYCAKSSKSERNAGCEGLEEKERSSASGNNRTRYCTDCKLTDNGTNDHSKCKGEIVNNISKPSLNAHPTVKPLRLMRYLIRLITPPGGVCLDPFMGSGSTGVAALQEGFRFIGIEKEQEYVAIAEKRIEATCVS